MPDGRPESVSFITCLNFLVAEIRLLSIRSHLNPSSPFSRPRLPYDVHPLIIESLHHPGEWPDADTLAQCALVCREWYQCSKKGLYHQIEISEKAQYQLLETTFRKDGSLRSEVRILSVHDIIPGERVSPAILHAPKQLPQLELLFIFGVHNSKNPAPCYHSSLYMNLSQFHSIRLIHLHGFVVDSLDVLRRMLSALPGLESAVFRTVSWTKAESSQFRPLFRATSWKLSQFSIADSPSNFIAPFFWAKAPQGNQMRVPTYASECHPPLSGSDVVPVVELTKFVLNPSESTVGSICWEWGKSEGSNTCTYRLFQHLRKMFH